MGFKVKTEQHKQAHARLYLYDHGDGNVLLMENGGENCIMLFNNDGTFSRSRGVEVDGIALDSKGRIKENE